MTEERFNRLPNDQQVWFKARYQAVMAQQNAASAADGIMEMRPTEITEKLQMDVFRFMVILKAECMLETT